MSVLFLDSFDHYDVMDEKWDAAFFGTNIKPVLTEGRFTPGALEISGSGGGGSQTKNLPATVEIIAGFAYNNTPADIYVGNFRFTDDQGNAAILFIDTTSGIGTLQYNGESIATAAAVFTGSAWQHVEFRIKQHATLGELEIRRNGSLVASDTGLNTLPASVTGFTSFAVTAVNNAQQHHMDDLYIFNTLGTTNNTFAGDTRITVLRPTANGLDNNFTPFGSGANFSAVNETTHDQDTTYVEAGQLGAQEKYTQNTFTNLGINPGTIFCTQVVNAAKKTDAGTLKYRDQMIIGGLEFDNGVDVIATSGTYQMTFFVRDTDPSDNGAWTEAKIDAVGSGIEITFREV